MNPARSAFDPLDSGKAAAALSVIRATDRAEPASERHSADGWIGGNAATGCAASAFSRKARSRTRSPAIAASAAACRVFNSARSDAAFSRNPAR
ncbi:MAG: hypothetical protein ABR915_24055 [Thermoguttaceae bacterium]